MLQSDDLPAGLASARWVRRVLLVVLFSIAFGYVEAALVVYLRGIYDPIRASLYPDKPADSLLPLMTLEQLREVDPVHIRRLGIELGREVATMIMLAALAVLAARHRGEGIAMFMIAFGAWDIAYYIGLKAMIDWPASLLAWDLLFLIPVPWLGPVLAPVIVAATMVAAGLVILAEVEHGRLPRARWYHWAGIVIGALVIIVSFCKDAARTTAGEMPAPFSWTIFAAGEVIGLIAFGHALRQGRRSRFTGDA